MKFPLIRAVERFLDEQGFLNESEQSKKLIHDTKSFWQYENGFYEEKNDQEIMDEFLNFLANDSSLREHASDQNCKSAISILRTRFKNKNVKNCRLLNEIEDPAYYIPVQNGLLKVNISDSGISYELQSLTNKVFYTYQLNPKFEPNAKCDLFLKTIGDILAPEEITFFFEMLGYLLIPVHYANRAFFFIGEGANGKSVLCLILKLIIGEKATSNVAIQSFGKPSDFSIGKTERKLLNIVEELDNLKNFPTGFFKDYISGNSILANRKNKDHENMEVTARLVYAGNVVPSFNEDSQGLKRRIIILPFLQDFSDESKQNKNLLKKKFWIDSGELEGIFMMALAGLDRLVKNNWKFTQGSNMLKYMNDYTGSMNPAVQFLKDQFEYHPNSRVVSKSIYKRYAGHCHSLGFECENATVFGRQIKRVFPLAYQSENAIVVNRENKQRDRIWYGIRLKPIHDTEESISESLLEENEFNLLENQGSLNDSAQAS